MHGNIIILTIFCYNEAQEPSPCFPCADDEFRKASDNEGEITLGYLVEVIKEGISDNSIRNDIHIQKTAFVLYANIIGISNLVLNKEDYLLDQHLSAKELIQEMFNLIERSIKK